ncbi:MAG: VWA domain-containing protein [Polyangiaceae bacterium]
MADHCLRRRPGVALSKRSEPARPAPVAKRRRFGLGLGLFAAALLASCTPSNQQTVSDPSAPTKPTAAASSSAVSLPKDIAQVTLPADPKTKEPLAPPIVDPPPPKEEPGKVAGRALSGEGRGGGGEGEGIGLGSVGTIGHGAGTGSGAGFGSGHGRLGGSHATKGPKGASGSAAKGSMWGDEIGESYGAGGLGLSGVGEGGGGAGVSGGAVGRGAVAGKPSRSRSGAAGQQARGVKAGEWDDNANYRDFLKYQKGEGQLGAPLDVTHRRFLVVRDAKNQPIPNCQLKVQDKQGKSVILTTQANGRAILFPRASGLKGSLVKVTVSCLGHEESKQLSVAAKDGALDFKLPLVRALPDNKVLDIAFILDTTGSMSEEISAMKDTLEEVAKTLKGMSITPRIGLVEYRDKGDVYLTRTHQMTTDISGFADRVSTLSANGGGDMPEHVNEGIRVALTKLKWSDHSLGRLAFLIGDAPPQLRYTDDTPYTKSILDASERGIQLHTIAASGMDDLGQSVWRQIAMFTGGTNLFVLRGGAGPQSTGAGDPKDSCGSRHDNYTSGNLAELISNKVQTTVDSLSWDPMKIAGLGKDEKSKPCSQRVAQQ